MTEPVRGTALVEARVLDGPNLYVPRPAVKVTLDASHLMALPEPEVAAVARSVGLPGSRPGAPGTDQRQRFALRLIAHLTRRVAAEAGTTRLAVRARAGPGRDRLVVAYPWRHRSRAEAMAAALGEVVAGLGAVPVDTLIARAGRTVSAADLGAGPDLPRPAVPVVSVTGTNGKTTTTRLIAHLCRTAGRSTGWTSTDGIYVDGELVEAGDWSGPGGARRVLAEPVDVAVLETARGGLLLRGMGVAWNDVAVVTNVSADHLGLHGVDTVDQLAEVKAVITRVTRPSGWLVLNGEDPRVFAMRTGSRARTWVFALSPDAPAVRQTLTEGGRAATVLDGDLVVLPGGADPVHLLPVLDVPVTLAGLSPHNVANALAATAAGLALGLAADDVVAGLRTFVPDVEHNPGRMNVFDLSGVTVVVDFAHNPDGLAALLAVADGLRAPGRAVRLALSAAGDRRDTDIEQLGELAARHADDVLVVQVDKYLRGRTAAEMTELFDRGARAVGRPGFEAREGELGVLVQLLDRAEPGDVVAQMCHAERDEVLVWLAEQGARPLDPRRLRDRVAGRASGGA